MGAFLAGRLDFPGIASVVERTLEAHEAFPITTAAEAARATAQAGKYAEGLIGRG